MASVAEGSAAQAGHVHLHLRGLPPGEPRRVAASTPASRPRTQRRCHRAGARRRRRDLRGRRPPHGPCATVVGGARRHLAAVLRGQGVRGGARARATSRPPTSSTSTMLERRVRRVRRQARARRPDRGQRGQPRPQAVPARSSADVIDILQDGLGLLLRGEVIWRKARGAGGTCAWGSFQQAGQPGAARPHRAGDHRQQGPLRPGPRSGAPRASTASRRSRRSPPTSSWRPPSTCGRSRPRAPPGSATRRRSPSSCRSG